MLSKVLRGVRWATLVKSKRALSTGLPQKSLINFRQPSYIHIVLSWLVYIFLVTAGRGVLVYKYWQSETQSEHALKWNRATSLGACSPE